MWVRASLVDVLYVLLLCNTGWNQHMLHPVMVQECFGLLGSPKNLTQHLPNPPL